MFTPGAGCTGPTKLVRPGDEMIFNSSFNPAEWSHEKCSVASDVYEEGGLTSTCPENHGSLVREFKPPLPATDLVELANKNFSEETMKQIRWVRKMYNEWHAFRNGSESPFIECDLEDKATISVQSLQFTLVRFVMEIKKLNGDDYPGKTLYHIIICIQFYLECLGFAFRLLNDPFFKDLKFTVDNTMKS